MSRSLIVFILMILVLAVVLVFVLDVFDLKQSREGDLARIVHYEDSRLATEGLLAYCGNDDPEIRKRTALALGRIGGRKHIDSLFVMLHDEAEEVPLAAAFAIGLAGDKSDASRLLELSESFDPELDATAVQAIGRLLDSTDQELCHLLAQKLYHVDHRVREQAIYAVFRANYKDAWPELVRICRNDSVRPVQIAALFALTRLRISEPVDLYEAWHSDADEYARSLAYRGLSLAKEKAPLTTIASGLNDRSNNVVSQAISSLTSIGTPEASEYLAKRIYQETDDKLKVQIYESLSRLEDSTVIDMADIDLHDDSVSTNIKAAAINYLATVRGVGIIPLIDTLAVTENVYFRRQLIGALKTIGGKSVQPRLMAFFKDSVAIVRADAFDALTAVDSTNIEYYLNSALADEDYVVNTYAIYKIPEMKKSNHLPQLMTLLTTADKRETTGSKARYCDVEIKQSIADAVGMMMSKYKDGAAPPDSLAEEILFRCLHDPDYNVSKKAAEVYKDKLDINKDAYIKRPDPIASARDLKNAFIKYHQNPHALIRTAKGNIKIELYFDQAPLTVYNFIRLAETGYFNNLEFHRVVPNFVIQGGDPRYDGWGGPGYSIRAENNPATYSRGAVGMADGGLDTGGSQFFIALSPQPHLDVRYTLFGQVVEGMEIADNIYRGDTIMSINILDESSR